MAKTHGLTMAALCTLGVACLADRGPKVAADAGREGAADGPVDVGVVCPLPAGGNELSFDLDCSGACQVKTHLDFHIDPASPVYPGCGEGNRILIFADLEKPSAPVQFSGNESSSLAMMVNGYMGPSTYALAKSPGDTELLFDLSFNTAPPCSDQTGAAPDFSPLIIEDGPSDLDAADGRDAGAPPSCTVDVKSDCAAGTGTHTVAGTLTCSFEDVGGGWSCAIKNGRFQFGQCIP
jgi:hypothetical protein